MFGLRMSNKFIESAFNYWVFSPHHINHKKRVMNSLVLFNIEKPKNTGKMFGINTYNHIFVKVKDNWFTPIIYPVIKYNINPDNFLKPVIRVRKIIKYYTEGHYNKIEDVMVHGNNLTTNLLMLLALWTPYDLVNKTFKFIDKKLFTKYNKILYNYFMLNYSYSTKLFDGWSYMPLLIPKQ